MAQANDLRAEDLQLPGAPTPEPEEAWALSDRVGIAPAVLQCGDSTPRPGEGG
jgi:hypothetical protein